MIYALGDGIKTIIQRATGMSVEEIDRADHETIQGQIEKKIGHKLEFHLESFNGGHNFFISPEKIECDFEHYFGHL